MKGRWMKWKGLTCIWDWMWTSNSSKAAQMLRWVIVNFCNLSFSSVMQDWSKTCGHLTKYSSNVQKCSLAHFWKGALGEVALLPCWWVPEWFIFKVHSGRSVRFRSSQFHSYPVFWNHDYSHDLKLGDNVEHNIDIDVLLRKWFLDVNYRVLWRDSENYSLSVLTFKISRRCNMDIRLCWLFLLHSISFEMGFSSRPEWRNLCSFKLIASLWMTWQGF